MTDEKIMTLHPEDGKSGVNISKIKYEQVRDAIISALEQEGELYFEELGEKVGQQLEGKFKGSIGWYYTTVKLDLEARGEIERVDNRSPQRLRLAHLPKSEEEG